VAHSRSATALRSRVGPSKVGDGTTNTLRLADLAAIATRCPRGLVALRHFQPHALARARAHRLDQIQNLIEAFHPIIWLTYKSRVTPSSVSLLRIRRGRCHSMPASAAGPRHALSVVGDRAPPRSLHNRRPCLFSPHNIGSALVRPSNSVRSSSRTHAPTQTRPSAEIDER